MLACDGLDWSRVETPAYVIDLAVLERNLELLAHAQAAAGCTVLLALKAFATWSTFPLVGKHLHGVSASGPYEARLGREELGKQVHTYCPAFDEGSLREAIRYSDHVIFNSPSQIDRLRAIIDEHAATTRFGLRINPQHSEVQVPLYDPCARGSRLGTTKEQLVKADLRGIDGLHIHTLCELGADSLERTLNAFEDEFSPWLDEVRWVNLGGGHHITEPGYDVGLLIDLIRTLRRERHVEVFLEPGEAVALNAGVLVTSVLDIMHNDGANAIVDASASAHMPDVLEMPYRPRLRGACESEDAPHTYRLGGLTCLAGDVIGTYSFEEPLEPGNKLVFEDMAHYTIVKNTTFNGVRLPSIAFYDPRDDSFRVQRRFGYDDYRNRLS